VNGTFFMEITYLVTTGCSTQAWTTLKSNISITLYQICFKFCMENQETCTINFCFYDFFLSQTRMPLFWRWLWFSKFTKTYFFKKLKILFEPNMHANWPLLLRKSFSKRSGNCAHNLTMDLTMTSGIISDHVFFILAFSILTDECGLAQSHDSKMLQIA